MDVQHLYNDVSANGDASMLKVWDDEGEKIVALSDLDEGLTSDEVSKKMDEWEEVNAGDVDMSPTGDIPFLGYVVGGEDDPLDLEDSTPDETKTFDEWMNDLRDWCEIVARDNEEEDEEY